MSAAVSSDYIPILFRAHGSRFCHGFHKIHSSGAKAALWLCASELQEQMTGGSACVPVATMRSTGDSLREDWGRDWTELEAVQGAGGGGSWR